MPEDREEMTPGSDFPRSVVIYGTGLMGCSFALALRRRFPKIRVFGVDSPEILARARRLGAVESAEAQPSELTVLATPVGAILTLLDKLPKQPSLILDLGSTKVAVCRKAQDLGLPFIGGHPMTGSERSGPEAASADLFKDKPFFLCPVSTTPADAIPYLTPVLEGMGAHPIVIDPQQHDKIVAQLSHLPQILSTLLADQTSANKDLAGPGWRSVVRLAASPFHVWRDILETSGSLPEELQIYIIRLRSVLDALEAGNMKELEAIFERANRAVTGGTDE
jgi:prephenate dehydrogenase